MLAVGFSFCASFFADKSEESSDWVKKMSKTDSESRTENARDLGLGVDLSSSEREFLQEVLSALRAIRYGSVILTVHDGHIVEIQKTERIRRGTGKQS